MHTLACLAISDSKKKAQFWWRRFAFSILKCSPSTTSKEVRQFMFLSRTRRGLWASCSLIWEQRLDSSGTLHPLNLSLLVEHLAPELTIESNCWTPVHRESKGKKIWKKSPELSKVRIYIALTPETQKHQILSPYRSCEQGGLLGQTK